MLVSYNTLTSLCDIQHMYTKIKPHLSQLPAERITLHAEKTWFTLVLQQITWPKWPIDDCKHAIMAAKKTRLIDMALTYSPCVALYTAL